MGRRISEAQASSRGGSEESVEQKRGPMNKNRITSLPGRTSELLIAKSTAIKAGVVNSAGVRRRRSILPREICVVSPQSGLRSP